jgi:DNA helicase II / ATP-dependent DNA helicase PcrA
MGSGTLARLKELRESPGSRDFFEFLNQLHDENAAFNLRDKYQRLEELETLIKEPFFSRIDLHDTETNETKEFYIGKFGYSEKDPVVTDWRAKVASVYYRYRFPQKGVFYDTPGGREVRDLKLKRTYEIDSGKILKYYNNDLQLDENELISEKVEKRTGGVLEDIISTIQESQLDIIESDPRQITVVQGCVGSGKSTVAIHKLSHIFFNYPKLIRPERSLLIAKNQILVGYLSTLFPKLGIFNVTYKTLRDLVVNIVYREKLKIKVDLDLTEDTASFDMKVYDKVEKSAEALHLEFEDRINDIFKPEELEPFGGYKYSQKITVLENINDISKDLEEELIFQKQALKENPDSTRSWFHKENVKSLRKIMTRLGTLEGELTRKSFPKILKEFDINVSETLGYYKSLVYLYLYARIIGFKELKKYEYCVVDEGQDFSILEYLVLKNFVLRGRFAIFGDLNQSLEQDGVTSWKLISKIIPEARNPQVFELETNYRSTKPIIDLANKILSPYTKKYLPKSINRRGKDPTIENLASQEEMVAEFETNVRSDLETLDKSIGIICFNRDILEKTEEILKKSKVPKKKLLILDSKKKIEYLPKGVYLMNFEDCKGLEFAKVYVLGLNLDEVSNVETARKAFVAVTRAMNELSVYGVKTAKNR